MKRRFMFLIMVIITAFALVACNSSDENNDANGQGNKNTEAPTEGDNSENADGEEVNGKVDKDEDADPLSKEELSELLVEAIANKDMKKVAKYMDPNQGLLFSPYIYVDEDSVVLSEEEVETMLESDEVRKWGYFDGSGEAIELTGAQYYEEFLNLAIYAEPNAVLINDLQERGNTLNNVAEVYPDAETVEFYYEGTEEYVGMDWSSLLFVYEENESGEWLLVAIVRDLWTV